MLFEEPAGFLAYACVYVNGKWNFPSVRLARDPNLPEALFSREMLDTWQREEGFRGGPSASEPSGIVESLPFYSRPTRDKFMGLGLLRWKNAHGDLRAGNSFSSPFFFPLISRFSYFLRGVRFLPPCAAFSRILRLILRFSKKNVISLKSSMDPFVIKE